MKAETKNPKQKTQKKKLTEYQMDLKKTEELDPIKLYVCTIFPGKLDDNGKAIISEEMDFNRRKLSKIEGLEAHFIWNRAGEFSHRHLKEVPDPEQIAHRNFYLDKVPVDEWFLVLDADELLFGALDNIPTILRIMNARFDIDYAMISELLPNGELKLRPRLIKKREGLKYGGPLQKHDYIEYCIHGWHKRPHTCSKRYNYIDVKAESRSWLLDFLGFFHYKNGWAMELYSNDDGYRFEIPSNMVQLDKDMGHKEFIEHRIMEKYPTEEFDVSSVGVLNESMERELVKGEKRYDMYKEELRD